MSLRSELYGLIDRTARICANIPEAKDMLKSFKDLRERLDKPLRVAVVGMVSAGKSTFMNALMGENIATTGTAETTYTVSWFRYGKTPSLTVRFRDGEEIDLPYEELGNWSVRASAQKNGRMEDVEYLIVNYPAEVLKTIEFIDTPGLDSMYGTDSQNTMSFLSIDDLSDRGSKDTVREAGKADAVIFVMSGPVTGLTYNTLMAFYGNKASNTSPINSIGIMTKQDNLWKNFGESAGLLEKIDLHKKQMENESVRNALFTILPVFSKAAEGCSLLEQEEWEALELISKKDRELLAELLEDEYSFCNESDEDYMEFGEIEIRKKLMNKLASFGIMELTGMLHKGKTIAEIKEELRESCGINAIRQMLLHHFGNRTFLIKAQYIFSRMHSMIRGVKNPELSEIVSYVKGEIDRIMSSVHTLKELKVLQMYYNRELDNMSEEEKEDLLCITGEYGRNPEVRLNVGRESTISEMAEIAKEKAMKWNSASANSWMVSSSYAEATAIISRSYSLLHYHLSAIIEE